MSIRFVRHLGNINPDHVQAVKSKARRFSYGNVRRYKDGPKKGRPRAWVTMFGNVRRPYIDWFEGGRNEPAKVHIWWHGDTYPLTIECATDAMAERTAAEIRADLGEGVGTERIVAAAVKETVWHSGTPMRVVHVIEAPARHPDILYRMSSGYDEPVAPDAQGFLTSTGRFVGRKDAFLLALAAGQLSPDVAAKKGTVVPDLFSEDLW